MPAVPYRDLSAVEDGASSEEMLGRVKEARAVQAARFKKGKIHCNAQMNSRQIKRHCVIDAESGALLEKAMEQFGLSARAHSRILKISRTIADLDGSENIQSSHVAEAIQYRTLDRKISG